MCRGWSRDSREHDTLCGRSEILVGAVPVKSRLYSEYCKEIGLLGNMK